MEVANAVKEVMKLQWSSLIMPGKEVKVKLTGCKELSSAVVVECYYTLKHLLTVCITMQLQRPMSGYMVPIVLENFDFVTSCFSGHFKVL